MKIKVNELTDNKNSKIAKLKTLKNSHTKTKFRNKVNGTNNCKIIVETFSKLKDKNTKSNTSDYLGIIALVAKMEPATESQEFSRKKLPLKSHPSNKIKILLDSGSDEDL